MGAVFDLLPLEPRSRMTGVWKSRVPEYGTHDLHAMGHLIWLGEGQDPDVEWDFLGSHLRFNIGGITGMGPDGGPWMLLLQVAPLVGRADEAVEMMTEAMGRALDFNPSAWVGDSFAWSAEDLRVLYAKQGVDVDDVLDWGVVDLVFGLLAECCNVELTQIVSGRMAQCAFPDDEHECTHDVFTDVFSRWVTGVLMIDESALDDDEDDEDPRFTREELLAYSLPDLRSLAREVDFKPWQIMACGDDLAALADLVLSVYEEWVSPKRLRKGRRKAKRALGELKTSRLRLLAVSVGWSIRDAERAKRKQLIKALIGPMH